jgi:hypothetical protein
MLGQDGVKMVAPAVRDSRKTDFSGRSGRDRGSRGGIAAELTRYGAARAWRCSVTGAHFLNIAAPGAPLSREAPMEPNARSAGR